MAKEIISAVLEGITTHCGDEGDGTALWMKLYRIEITCCACHRFGISFGISLERRHIFL